VEEMKDATAVARSTPGTVGARSAPNTAMEEQTACEAKEAVCVVAAVRMFFGHFPQRYLGGGEEDEPLLPYAAGVAVTRMEFQAVLGRAAVALGHSDHHFGSRSLRFGGASVLWAAFHDSAMVRRWGR
jgi:hypothetical protein